MAVGDELVLQLRATLQLLERADAEAVKAKQQVARIIGIDFQSGTAILLVESFFTVEGIKYHATVTPQQRDAIQLASSGTTQEVIDALADMLNDNLFAGALLAIETLIGALQNQPPPSFAAAPASPSTAGSPLATAPSLGACLIGGMCKPNFDATLCQTLGGQPKPVCPEIVPR